jgi:hypothetical protein
VRLRAQRRCEYCRLHENDLPLFTFHVEHIIARNHGGTDWLNNLAWSCHHCNLSKSSNLSGRDRATGRIVPLFDPRRQRWGRHFQWRGPRLVGRSACGRATITVLNMNAPHRLNLRRLLIRAGLFPPD